MEQEKESRSDLLHRLAEIQKKVILRNWAILDNKNLLELISEATNSGIIDDTEQGTYEIKKEADSGGPNQIPWGQHYRFAKIEDAQLYASHLSKLMQKRYIVKERKKIKLLSGDALASRTPDSEETRSDIMKKAEEAKRYLKN